MPSAPERPGRSRHSSRASRKRSCRCRWSAPPSWLGLETKSLNVLSTASAAFSRRWLVCRGPNPSRGTTMLLPLLPALRNASAGAALSVLALLGQAGDALADPNVYEVVREPTLMPGD